MRPPGVMMPTRFSGSAALTEIKLSCASSLLIGNPLVSDSCVWPGDRKPKSIAPVRGATNRSQHSDRFRQRKLFTGNSRDKTPAANFAARFQSVIDAQQHSPGKTDALAFEQAFENHAVALEQNARDFFGSFGVDRPFTRMRLAGLSVLLGCSMRPASGARHFINRLAVFASRRCLRLATARRQQRAQSCEAVGDDQSICHQFSQ